MMKMLFGYLIFIVIGRNVSEALPKCLQVTVPAIQQVTGALPMYVDELPQMPIVYGYASGHGSSPKPGHLTIGMFEKQWVCVCIYWLKLPIFVNKVVLNRNSTEISRRRMYSHLARRLQPRASPARPLKPSRGSRRM